MEQLCARMADIILLKCPDWMLSRFLRVMSEALFGESFYCVGMSATNGMVIPSVKPFVSSN